MSVEATGEPEPEPDEVGGPDGETVFTIELMASTGESWVWGDLEVDEAMDVYEMLGEADTFRRLGG